MSTYAERLAHFGYASVIRGADPENNERLRKELTAFVERENERRKTTDLPTLLLKEQEMTFSIYPKAQKTKQDFELEKAWNQQTKK